MPMVKMNEGNFMSCQLPDDTRCLALFDSGSSRTMIGESLVKRSIYLSGLPKTVLPQIITLTVGDGNEVVVNQFIDFVALLDNCKIPIRGFILRSNSPVDLVLGSDMQEKYRAIFNARNHEVSFEVPSFELHVAETVVLSPGHKTPVVLLAPMECRTHIHGAFEIQLRPMLSQFLCEFVIADFKAGRASFYVFNDNDREQIIEQGTIVGELTLASVMVNYESCVSVGNKDECTFRVENDKNALDGKALVIVDYGENTVSDYLNEEIRFDELSPEERKSTRLKLFPWLEPDDPRLTKTDKEIIYSQLDTSDTKLTEEQCTELISILGRNAKAFSLWDNIGALKRYAVDLTTDVKEDLSYVSKPYIVSAEDVAFTRKELDRLIALGIFEPGLSTVTSSLFLVRRTPTAKPRIVCDLRRVNKALKLVNRPGTTFKSFCQAFGRKRCLYLTSLDIRQAYHAIKLHNRESQALLGVCSYPNAVGLVYKTLAMGLKSSCSYFQQIMGYLIAELPTEFQESILFYFDDVLIFTETAEQHLKVLDALLELFRKHGLVLSLEKAKFCVKDRLEFLGYDIIVSGPEAPVLGVKKSRVEALLKLRPPESKTDIKRFLGSCQYISMFLQNYQTIVNPLTHLLKKAVPFEWGEKPATCLAKYKGSIG